MTTYSITLPTFNEEEAIGRTIDSIKAQELDHEAEIQVIVVDNGSTDRTVELAKEHGAEVITNDTGKRVTISTLRNWGAKQSRCEDIIGFVDGDMEVPKNWLQTAINHLKGDIDCLGCVSMVPPEAGWVARTWFDPGRRSTRPIWDVDFLPGRNIVLKKTVFEHVKGFDEELVTAEDKDFTYRINQAGYRVVHLDQPRVMHLGYETDMRVYLRKEFWRQKSALAFAKKHKTMRTLRNPLLGFWHVLFFFLAIITSFYSPIPFLNLICLGLLFLPSVLITFRGGGKSPGLLFYGRLFILTFLRWMMAGFGGMLHLFKNPKD